MNSLVQQLLAWFTHRPIGAKIFVCFSGVIAVGLASGIFTFNKLAQLEATQYWTTHTYQVKEAASALLSGIWTKDAELRGYLLTRDPRFLQQAEAQRPKIQANFERIRDLTADNANQQRRIGELATFIQAWRRDFSAIPAPDPKEIQAAKAQPTEIDKEKPLAPLLQKLDEITREEERLLDRRVESEAGALVAARWANVIGPVGAIIVALLVGWLLHSKIAIPISKLTMTMRRIAKGDTSVAIPNATWKEEIGEMGRALQGFRDDVAESRRLRQEQQDVRLRHKRERDALMTSMADRFEAVVGSIVKAVSASTGEMQTSAATLLDLAEWTSGQVREVASSTKSTSATMQSVARDTESLLSSVGEINAQMAQSTDIAEQAVAEADRTTTTIESLSQTAKRIGMIVDLINDVARQTNLLALNATIEAARAGDAGRGFAVVATEVKMLADQTATATAEIRQQIEGMQGAASGSVLAIGQISRTIAEMAGLAARLSSASDAQGQATKDMVYGTQASARATLDVSAQLEKVSDGAVTTGTAATKVLATAKDLAQQTNLLREEAQRFVSSVRAS